MNLSHRFWVNYQFLNEWMLNQNKYGYQRNLVSHLLESALLSESVSLSLQLSTVLLSIHAGFYFKSHKAPLALLQPNTGRYLPCQCNFLCFWKYWILRKSQWCKLSSLWVIPTSHWTNPSAQVSPKMDNMLFLLKLHISYAVNSNILFLDEYTFLLILNKLFLLRLIQI